MWDGLFMLLALSTVMAIASFLAGALPLSLKLSQQKLRLLSAIGTGVLVGTSLIVIIPEGIETLYSSHSASARQIQTATESTKVSVAPRQAGLEQHIGKLVTLSRTESPANQLITQEVDGNWHTLPSKWQYLRAALGLTISERNEADLPRLLGRRDPFHQNLSSKSVESDSYVPHEESKREGSHESNSHAWIGLSLIAGYVLMYLIDTLPTLAKPLSHPRALHISLSDLSQGLHHSPSSPSGSPSLRAVPDGTNHTSATTIGLVIHAFADGIALGASTASAAARSSLGLVVFLAIMLHKAPAAFGLTSVLLKQGLSRREARGHLLVFSLAAPVGAFVTWALVNIVGKGGKAEGKTELWWTGIVLVFSGGTFLYVAMHSMQEANQHYHGDGLDNTGYVDEVAYRSQKSGNGIEIGAAVLGMLLPLITQLGHAH